MKVTVCFGTVKIVVPCGEGNLTISELTEKSITRYKKAIGRPPDYWVSIHNLKSSNDGGILDPDDLLSDVADDREQRTITDQAAKYVHRQCRAPGDGQWWKIVALFEEEDEEGDRGGGHHNGGDGTSASSVGTSSPDIFHGNGGGGGGNGGGGGGKGFRPFLRDGGGKNDVIITESDLQNGSTLIVRRGSEPALVNLCDMGNQQDNDSGIGGGGGGGFPIKSNKRWSAIASLDETKSPRVSPSDNGGPAPPLPSRLPQRVGGNGQDAPPPPPAPSAGLPATMSSSSSQGSLSVQGSLGAFSRDSSRRSLANNVAMWKWLEAAEKTQDGATTAAGTTAAAQGGENNFQIQQDRKDPVGGISDGEDSQKSPASKQEESAHEITIRNTGGPLGIHVVPDFDNNGRDRGLVIQGIEPGGRIYKDGRLAVHDRISKINGTSLLDVDFSKSQEIFKQALQTEEIRLRVVKSTPPLSKQAPPPLLPKPMKPRPLELSLPRHQLPDSPVSSPIRPSPNEPKSPTTSTPASSRSIDDPSSEPPPGSPIKKVPPAVPARNPNTMLTSPTSPTGGGGAAVAAKTAKIIAPTNTKRIGKKIQIDLLKGMDGLGFSVTTRDISSGGPTPIYIKNILPRGAAIQDGRLKPGDRLLEVNGTEITGKSQAETVGLLRAVPQGSMVIVVVSRQVMSVDDAPPTPIQDPSQLPSLLPRELTPTLEAETDDKNVEIETSTMKDPQDNTTDEGVYSLPNKSIFRLDVPLNDTGSAGLGVSVKGKTSNSPTAGSTDLGIFIKAVITGGAAWKDGRIHVNDQLLDVNGESLLSQSNADAMETLRRAMQKDLPNSGHIHLVVARRKKNVPLPDTPTNLIAPSSAARDVRISMSDFPQDGAGSSSDSGDSAGIRRNIEAEFFTTESMTTKPPLRNPALERLVGGGGGGGEVAGDNHLRNTSYQRATHDSIMDSSLGTDRDTPQKESIKMRPHPNPKQRPASTLGFLRPPHAEGEGDGVRGAQSSEDLLDGAAPEPPEWLAQWEKHKEATGGQDGEDDGLAFQREAFGRRSMSEKRKGHIDPKMSEFYQKIKENRDTKGQYCSGRLAELGTLRRAGSAESLLSNTNMPASSSSTSHLHEHNTQQQKADLPSAVSQRDSGGDVGLTLGLKKSSSLESLQTAVQEASATEDSEQATNSTYWRAPNRGVVRGRGCNLSFRAAVDRSYEEKEAAAAAAAAAIEAMEAVEEEDGGESIGQHSRASSFRDSDMNDNDEDADGKKMTRKKSKKEKQDKGLLKGLGNMFRFGKHRKTMEDRLPAKTSEEIHKERNTQEKNNNTVKQPSLTQEEQEKLQEQYRKLQEKAHLIEMQRQREHHIRQLQQSNASLNQYPQYPSRPAPPPPSHMSAGHLSQHAPPPHPSQYPHPMHPSQYPPQYPPQHPSQHPSQHSQHPSQHPQHPSQNPQHPSQNPQHPPHPSQHPPHPSQHPPPPQPPPSSSRYPPPSTTTPAPQGPPPPGSSPIQLGPEDDDLSPQSRVERIQQLRAEHQRRHRERQGVYPVDDREDDYEKQIQNYETQKQRARSADDRNRYTEYHIPPRPPQRAPDPYERPTSRLGHHQQSPDRYGHYANLTQIQDQIQRHDYYQQRYQQQQQQQQQQQHQPPQQQQQQQPPRQYQMRQPYPDPRLPLPARPSTDLRPDLEHRPDPRLPLPARPSTDLRPDLEHRPALRSRTPDPRMSDFYAGGGTFQGHDAYYQRGQGQRSQLSSASSTYLYSNVNQQPDYLQNQQQQRTTSPARPRAHTPNPGYASQQHHPPQKKSLQQTYSTGAAPKEFSRLYTEFDPADGSPYRRGQNEYAHEPNFGSLPRRHASQASMISSSAQV